MVPVIKKLKSVFSPILILAFLSMDCEGREDNGLQTGDPLFESYGMVVWAEPQTAEVDSPVTIIVQCRPMFDGKGWLRLQLPLQERVQIDSPIQHLPDLGEALTLPAIFIAGETYEQRFVLRILDDVDRTVGFSTMVEFDSVFVADSSRYYRNDSHELFTAMGRLIDNGGASGYVRIEVH